LEQWIDSSSDNESGDKQEWLAISKNELDHFIGETEQVFNNEIF
jgi:hypothetical protein